MLYESFEMPNAALEVSGCTNYMAESEITWIPRMELNDRIGSEAILVNRGIEQTNAVC
jgi:hypothetical protein